MAFSWRPFLEANGIPYVDRGANVARNHINIKCPLCGDDDPSEHMGLSLDSTKWGCWRNDEHRGIKPTRLIKAILQCSTDHALQIAGESHHSSTGAVDLRSHVADRLFPKADDTARKRALSAEFDSLTELSKVFGDPVYDRFFYYLESNRRFNAPDILKLCQEYEIYASIIDPWKYRIVFPLTMHGEVVNLHGRTILRDHEPRYMSTSPRDFEGCLGTKSIIFNHDALLKNPAKSLILCEGIFDALKMDYYGRDLGFRAACVFGTAVSNDQLELLYGVANHFENLFLLFDKGALSDTIRWSNKLSAISHSVIDLGEVVGDNVKDPGDCSPAQVQRMLEHIS